jgi:hypothetical protein
MRRCELRPAPESPERAAHGQHIAAWRAVAPQRAPRGTLPRICTLTVKGPRVVSPPTRVTPCARARSSKPIGKSLQPRRIGARHGQRQCCPGGRRAHGRHVAQIDGQGAVTDRARIGAKRENAAPPPMVSTETPPSRCLRGTRSKAASSPMPSTTPCCGHRARAVRGNSGLSSNSPRPESGVFKLAQPVGRIRAAATLARRDPIRR